jgi:hypothetical protein
MLQVCSQLFRSPEIAIESEWRGGSEPWNLTHPLCQSLPVTRPKWIIALIFESIQGPYVATGGKIAVSIKYLLFFVRDRNDFLIDFAENPSGPVLFVAEWPS